MNSFNHHGQVELIYAILGGRKTRLNDEATPSAHTGCQ